MQVNVKAEQHLFPAHFSTASVYSSVEGVSTRCKEFVFI
jgi:hypothetical protein